MKTLLPPSSSRVERSLEDATTRATNLPVNLRDLWNPETCPADLLPWLAWGLSVDAWKSYWPESVKRLVIRDAIAIQRKKGTRKAVEDVVKAFGSSLVLREWWQKAIPGEPYTFDIVINYGQTVGGTVTAQYQEDIITEVSRVKPVRSHFTVGTGLESSGGINLTGLARPAIHKRIELVG